jgi:hypothetical protein
MPHPYATGSTERKNITVFVVLVSTAGGVIISHLLNAFSITIPNWAEGPSMRQRAVNTTM